jgi:hypothetical protein
MSASLSGSGLILPLSELSLRNCGGTTSPAEPGCELGPRDGGLKPSGSATAKDESMLADFLLAAF